MLPHQCLLIYKVYTQPPISRTAKMFTIVNIYIVKFRQFPKDICFYMNKAGICTIMSNPINTKINPYQQQFAGPGQQIQIDPEKLKQGVNNTPVGKVAKQDNPAVMVGLTIPIWLGLSQLMSKFNHSCADQLDAKGQKLPNTLDKIGNFGDKIGQHKVFNNPVTDKIGGFWSNTSNFMRTKVINKSAVLRAFFDTPSVPTNNMVKTMAKGTIAEVANDAVTAIAKYTDSGKDLEKVAELGFKNYEKVMKDPRAHIDEIIEVCTKQSKACLKSGEPAFVDMTKKGSLQPVRNLFGRKIYWSEIKNKMTALKGLENPNQATAIGKILPKTSIRVLEGLTNGTAGGKFAILMQAYFLADAVVKTYKAPKGEKGKTFAENIIYNVGWYMTMPFGINLMHKFGGLQYTGMSKARVSKYRQAVEQFNEKAKVNGFADKAEYDAAKKSIKDMLSGKAAAVKIAEAKDAGHILKGSTVSKFYHKPLKWAGRVLTVGLEDLRGFTKANDSNFVKDLKNVNFKMKNIAGYPVRFGIFMFAIAPFLGKLCAKASHLVFGRPTKSVLDEEKPEAKVPQAPAGQVVTAPVVAQNPQVQTPTPTPIPNQVKPGGSLLKGQAQSAATASATAVTNPVVAKQTPAPQQNVQAQKTPTPVKTYSYIPSSAGVVIQPNAAQASKNDKVDSAFNKANISEQAALKLIAGH